MTSILDIYKSGEVRRWHSNPAMAHVCDTVAAHSSRVAKIILRFHPNPSMALIVAALTHDDGESLTGDVPSPAKRASPELARLLDRIEGDEIARLWGSDTRKHITPESLRWLSFADKLDAFITAEIHAPREVKKAEWLIAKHDLSGMADDLGIAPLLAELLRDTVTGR